MLSEEHKRLLLRIAREAIERHLRGDDELPPPRVDLPGASGVFVTIKRDGELRGCLGVLQLQASLAEEVARCARDSATVDPRFQPMTVDELPRVSLDVSMLGPLEPIDPLDERALVIGRHGVVVELGHRRGLLLPQVAVEWGWTREQFLAQTCRKAGLPPDAWLSGARVFRFDAEVFGE
jgi:AmmeMemoRadiSam system protein A